jgi:uncharacterized protein YlaI
VFRCQECQQSAARPTKVVVERKMVKHAVFTATPGPRGGMGSQIVREMNLCPECAGKITEAPIERAVVEQPPLTAKVDFDNHDPRADA